MSFIIYYLNLILLNNSVPIKKKVEYFKKKRHIQDRVYKNKNERNKPLDDQVFKDSCNKKNQQKKLT
jgi:hypothetical protein